MKPATSTIESTSGSRSAESAILWQLEIRSRPGVIDRLAQRVIGETRHAQWPGSLAIGAARGFLIQSNSPRTTVQRGGEARAGG